MVYNVSEREIVYQFLGKSDQGMTKNRAILQSFKLFLRAFHLEKNLKNQVFTPEGKFSRKWNNSSDSPQDELNDGKFNLPYGVTCLSSGEIIVADTGNYRLQMFTSKGKFIRKWSTISLLSKYACLPHGISHREVASDLSGSSYTNSEGSYLGAIGSSILAFVVDGFNKLISNISGAGKSEIFETEIIVTDASNHHLQVFTMVLN